ncbi:MAG: hypothetical protein ACPIOQ_60310, partial [Promethearchaeia archaeon]
SRPRAPAKHVAGTEVGSGQLSGQQGDKGCQRQLVRNHHASISGGACGGSGVTSGERGQEHHEQYQHGEPPPGRILMARSIYAVNLVIGRCA